MFNFSDNCECAADVRPLRFGAQLLPDEGGAPRTFCRHNKRTETKN